MYIFFLQYYFLIHLSNVFQFKVLYFLKLHPALSKEENNLLSYAQWLKKILALLHEKLRQKSILNTVFRIDF